MSGKAWFLYVDEGHGQRPATPDEMQQFMRSDALAAFDAPFAEYPKHITTGGMTVEVKNADDEARWRNPPTPARVATVAVEEALAQPEPVVADETVDAVRPDPLADVSVEMDNPIYNEPKKKKRR